MKEFKQYLEYFLDFLNFQNLAARNRTKESANKTPFTTTKLSFENLKDEIEPVILQNFELGYGK